ncbi:right-handed parallel beta-helix repeat-containing protein [Streptosporangium sp. NPDC004631]
MYTAAAALALVLSAALTTAPPAAADTTVGCDDTLTANVTLTADLTCANGSLTIDADNVTVDLAGHTLTGVVLRMTKHGGLTVRNGTITGVEYGLWLMDGGTVALSGVRLVGSKVKATGQTALAVGGTPHTCLLEGAYVIDGSLTIDNCTVHGAVGAFDGDGVLAVRSSVLTNGSLAVNQADNGVITGNVFDDFPVSVVGDSRNTLLRNNVFKNAGTGLELDYVSTAAITVEYNLFTKNSVGLSVPQRFYNINVRKNLFAGNRVAGMNIYNRFPRLNPYPVSENVFLGNGHSPGGTTDRAGNPVQGGIHLLIDDPRYPITLTRNTGAGNAGPLIWAPPGQVVDGGGNKGPCAPQPNPDLTCT